MNDDRGGPSRFRLAWRWKESGLTGASAWVRDAWIVEGWLTSLSGRHGDRMYHWIEAEAGGVSDRVRPVSHATV